jgi:hypothetical protein
MTVVVDIHKLWSGAGASPHAGHFGHVPFGLQPDAPCEFALTEVLEDADLSLRELTDEKILLAIAVNVGPTRRGETRAFHADGHSICFQTHRTFEFRGAAQDGAAEGQECCE